ncbi:MAG: di-trans,poly-cis-decaprenylcistransferase [Deltaproteobacteria bacterium]|nr:di-trans,poly-cis-decaprenylcistransferase [Deltaproteobacteria bacterium]
MPLNLPTHIAIIMDGNGRWAKAQGLPRHEGHARGVEAAEEIITAVREWKIPYLTLYAFSDENWRRPRPEIEALMSLLKAYLLSKQQKMLKNGIRFETIGDIAKLPQDIRDTIAETKEITKGGKAMTLVLALSYGARDEIVRAVRKMMDQGPLRQAQGAAGTRDQGPTAEEEFKKYLDTAEFPDPDLLIRTGGEFRLSNYLLWQAAYAELYFTPVMWPEFTPDELEKALEEFSRRERRFGKTSEQL